MTSSTNHSPLRHWRPAIGGALTMLVFVVLVPLVIAATGVVNVSAQESSGFLDRLLGFASSRSVAFHAPDEKNPFANDSSAISEALHHYKKMCVVCHGAPGLEPSEIAKGLHPTPPNLASKDTQNMTDGEIFWVISNGISSTGMPGFEDSDNVDARWKIVSFVRHLPDLTDAERSQLQTTDHE